jgi:hypothetical protein
MNEDFLHYIWKFGLFDLAGLKTTTGDDITIVQRGSHNRHQGPDFFNARIQIGETLWAGNVEIHTKASDWHKHNHTNDPAYQNTERCAKQPCCYVGIKGPYRPEILQHLPNFY